MLDLQNFLDGLRLIHDNMKCTPEKMGCTSWEYRVFEHVVQETGLSDNGLRGHFLSCLDYPDVLEETILGMPLFGAFVRDLHKLYAVYPGQMEMDEDVYSVAADLACVAGCGIFIEPLYFATPSKPDLAEFEEFAKSSFDVVRSGGRYGLVGAWLSHLVRCHGVHPFMAKNRLDEARDTGWFTFWFKNDVPERRMKSELVVVENGIVRRMNIYDGDFLVPGAIGCDVRFLF